MKRAVSLFLIVVMAFSIIPNGIVLAGNDKISNHDVIDTVAEIATRDKYDGRDYGIITPVKDQGNSNLCWAYSSMAAAEASILKSGIDKTVTKDTLSLNPVAAAYRVYKREADPLGNTGGDWQSVDYTQKAGDPLKIVKLCSMWWAPVKGNDATVNPYENPAYRFENAFYIPDNRGDSEQYIKSVKEAIAKYGGVTFQYNNLRETTYYNPKNEKGTEISPHACTIIGWDDNIPAENFVPGGAKRNGGWLVKNSYKSQEYFWLSYDNTSSCSYAFTFAPKEKYDYNYYYDGGMDDFALRNDKVMANVFKAQKGGTNGKDEYIKAVNVAVSGENVKVEVKVYKNIDNPYGGQENVPTSGGYEAATTSATYEHGGYVTVELDSPVKVEKDEWFSTVVKVSNDKGDAKIMTSYKNSKEMSYVGGENNWSNLKNYVGRIKVYTKLEDKQQEQSKTTGNFTNLIVMARFDDEEEFTDTLYQGTSVRKLTDNSYNTGFYSVSDYYRNVSNNNLQIDNLYLFNKGGSIKLSKKRGYYAEYSDENPIGYTNESERMQRMYELKEDWSEAINNAIAQGNKITNYDGTKTYGFDDLDKNNDGKIDAITIIYKNTTQKISVSWASPLWNYKDYWGDVTINTGTKTLTSGYYVQLTNSYDYLYKSSDNNLMFSIGVAAHEMGHILGLKDLYNSTGSSPVYYMSAMAKHLSPLPQFISLKEREAKGWITGDNLKTIKSKGEYTLKASGTFGTSDIVGYKLNIKGTNKTLYLEYRNFGENGNKYDCQSRDFYKSDGTKLKGLSITSGLVCYVADKETKFPNNMNCTTSKWNYEVLGGVYSTKSDAPLKENQEMDIYDKINVHVTEISGDTLKFEIDGDFEEVAEETSSQPETETESETETSGQPETETESETATSSQPETETTTEKESVSESSTVIEPEKDTTELETVTEVEPTTTLEAPKESVTAKPEQTTPKVTIEATTIRKNQTVSKFKKRKPTLKVKAKKKSVKLLIGKVVGATKYQVRYKQGKKWKIKYTKNRALTIKKLKSKKKVKIQVRAVMVYGKKKVYGLWVKKSVRVK